MYLYSLYIKEKYLFFVLLLMVSCTSLATVYSMPSKGQDVVGKLFSIRAENDDTLLTIGNRYDIGMHEMLEANPQLGLDEETASQPVISGKEITIPAQYVLPPFRKGIVVNLPELRLYYFTEDGQYVYTYPVGLGRDEWRTPLVSTRVVRKATDPVWSVPKSIHDHVLEVTGKDLPSQVMPGPENPLGPYAMYLATGHYLIHGTNQPWTIGKYVSSGCIRMHNEDVEQLFHAVKVGTPVRIINYSDKVGMNEGRLFLESHVPMEIDEPVSNLNPSSLETLVLSRVKSAHSTRVDWNTLGIVAQEKTGFPRPVSEGIQTMKAMKGNNLLLTKAKENSNWLNMNPQQQSVDENFVEF